LFDCPVVVSCGRQFVMVALDVPHGGTRTSDQIQILKKVLFVCVCEYMRTGVRVYECWGLRTFVEHVAGPGVTLQCHTASSVTGCVWRRLEMRKKILLILIQFYLYLLLSIITQHAGYIV
jgi:hypothetical protein